MLACRKGPLRAEPHSAFSSHRVKEPSGSGKDYLLADRAVRIYYDSRRHYFACRQVTRPDPASGHQTQVLTTVTSWSAPEVATAMFARWREENLFRFMRPRGLDALDSYSKVADDPTRAVPNPAKAASAKALGAARAAHSEARSHLGEVVAAADAGEFSEPREANAALARATRAVEAAATQVEGARAAHGALPAEVALGEVRPDAARLDDERKRLHDAIRMATWNAESALARALGPHCARAEDEAHSLLAEAFSASADLEVVGGELHVRLEPLSAPRRSRAIAALCAELSETETLYPGTDLRLVYSVKGY